MTRRLGQAAGSTVSLDQFCLRAPPPATIAAAPWIRSLPAVRLQASLPAGDGDCAAAARPLSIIAAMRRAKAGASITGSPSRIRA